MENTEGLRKGTAVRNRRSGNVGELMGRVPYGPDKIGFWCYGTYFVPIRCRSSSGKWRYGLWDFKNLELA